MRIALDIKNMSKLKRPTANDVIVYDGKEWYITTKSDLLKEANDLLIECQKTLEQCIENFIEFKNQYENDMETFKQDVSKHIIEITGTTKQLLELKGEKL